MDCCCKKNKKTHHLLWENKHYVSTAPFLLVQFQHLQSMLSETDPQLADVVRKRFPVWGAQQIRVQHSSRLSPLLFIVVSISTPKILLQVALFGFPLERLNEWMSHHHDWLTVQQRLFATLNNILYNSVVFLFNFFFIVNAIFVLNNW